MHDRSQPEDPSAPTHRTETGGIGIALFLIIAGLVLLAERLGWISPDLDWLFPVILLAWGAGELYRRVTAR